MRCQLNRYLYRLAHTRRVHLVHFITGVVGVLCVGPFASRRMMLLWLLLLLLLLLVRKLTLHVLMRAAIHLTSVRDSPRNWHHVSLFDSVRCLRRRDLRWEDSGHAMLWIRLSRLLRRVDVMVLWLLLEALSCYELAVFRSRDRDLVWLLL